MCGGIRCRDVTGRGLQESLDESEVEEDLGETFKEAWTSRMDGFYQGPRRREWQGRRWMEGSTHSQKWSPLEVHQMAPRGQGVNRWRSNMACQYADEPLLNQAAETVWGVTSLRSPHAETDVLQLLSHVMFPVEIRRFVP